MVFLKDLNPFPLDSPVIIAQKSPKVNINLDSDVRAFPRATGMTASVLLYAYGFINSVVIPV